MNDKNQENNLNIDKLFSSNKSKTDFFGNIFTKEDKAKIKQNVSTKIQEETKEINLNKFKEGSLDRLVPNIEVERIRKLTSIDMENIRFLDEIENKIKQMYFLKTGKELRKKIKSDILNEAIKLGIKEILR